MANRLGQSRSPYLQQHADNPVDWFPWGDEAFAAARGAGKPIFLSIGYSTCHWCHVMAHESFEDESIAAVLNEHFVSIKVDREERPDVDRVYMTFVQATTGAGGWPLSVWLTPDLEPFIGGTYFPPTSQWGRPGFIDVLTQVERAWRDDRARVRASATTFVERLRDATGADGSAPDRAPVAGTEAVLAGATSLAESFDPRHGGFGGAPKFPRPSELYLLLHAFAMNGDRAALQMALSTLRAMALGGIRDHVGGGFHRYSVDAEWRVPHFEKMLYDQAQLVIAYVEAAQASGEAFYATVAEDTLDYVLRDLTDPDGAFYSAEDADSAVPHDSVPGSQPDAGAHGGKKEGAFYVWSTAEIDRLLGDDAEIAKRRFGLSESGNAPSDPHGEFRGQNILYVAQTLEEIAARTERSADDVLAALVRARQQMFATRAGRPRPHRDEKVLTSWNGLMIAAFARAGRVLADSPRQAEWIAAAARAAGAVRERLWRPNDRRLFRAFGGGEAGVDAFCEDYACLVWGLTELFEATGDGQWLDWALELTDVQARLFFDEVDGGWFSTTGEDPSVLLRMKEDYDGAEPAAASVTVRNLLVLGRLVSDQSLVDRAGRTLERYGAGIAKVARVMPFMLANVARWHAPPVEVVLASRAGVDPTALRHVLGRTYMPWAVTVPLTVSPDGPGIARMPWLTSMTLKDDAATAYVCRAFACQAPVTDPAAFGAQLADAVAPRRIVL